MALTVAQIDAAIADILEGGQSATVDGVTYTKANLATLWTLRRGVEETTARSSGKRPVFRSFNMSRASNQ